MITYMHDVKILDVELRMPAMLHIKDMHETPEELHDLLRPATFK